MSSAFSSQWELKRAPESTDQLIPTAAIYKFLLPPPRLSSVLQHCVPDTAGHGSVRGCIPGSVRRPSQGNAPRRSQSHQPGLGQSQCSKLCPPAGSDSKCKLLSCCVLKPVSGFCVSTVSGQFVQCVAGQELR